MLLRPAVAHVILSRYRDVDVSHVTFIFSLGGSPYYLVLYFTKSDHAICTELPSIPGAGVGAILCALSLTEKAIKDGYQNS